jgi:hypothetical protein
MGTNKFACLVPVVREYWPNKAEEWVNRIAGAVGVAAFSAALAGILKKGIVKWDGWTARSR